MILKIYDKNMQYITAISEYKDLCIIEELESGYKRAQFSLPYHVLLAEEMKINIDNYLYIIKEINMENNNLYDVYCKPYFGTLQQTIIENISGTHMELQTALNLVLNGTDWSYILEQDVAGTFNVNIKQKTALEALQTIITVYQLEIMYDTLKKVIHLYKKRQKHTNMILINGTNLRNCKSQSDTYDLITRLIPIGANELTITNIHGSPWVENYDYTKEVITGYWFDETITSPEDLLYMAQQKIKELSIPHTSYKIKMIEFNDQLEVGDQVHIIDNIRKINSFQRIAKTVNFPNSPEKSFIELGVTTRSFDKMYKDFQEVQKNINRCAFNSIEDLRRINTELEGA